MKPTKAQAEHTLKYWRNVVSFLQQQLRLAETSKRSWETRLSYFTDEGEES